jgi:hypothetical protein
MSSRLKKMSSRLMFPSARAAAVLALSTACVLCLALGVAAPALAQGPWWRLESRAAPSNLPPGGEAQIIVSASNVGDATADGTDDPITVADTLPSGLTATSITGRSSFPEELPMSCSLATLSCTYAEDLPPFDRLEVTITVKIASGLEGQQINTVTVNGGGAPTTPPLTSPVKISAQPTSFGLERLAFSPENEGGATDTQAGSHPYQLTTTFDVNQILAPALNKNLYPQAPALVRNLNFHLPPGLVGNPTAVAQCSDVDFSTIAQDGLTNLCQPNTAVGVAVVTINEPEIFSFTTIAVPIFNLTPARGEPARFGFEVFKVPVVLDTAVKSGEGYGVVVSVSDASQAAAILGTQVTFWGQPGAASHDDSRGWACLDLPHGARKDCSSPSEHSPAAFLTLPTACSGQPLQTSVDGVSWPTDGAPNGVALTSQPAFIEMLEGCERLPFAPTIDVEPDEHSASTPSGLTVDVKVPQQGTVTGDQLAESAIRQTTVTLPEGVQISPSAASGLLVCTGAQVGLAPSAQESAQVGNESFSEVLPACPEQAKVATVQIKTPLLDHELTGDAYLASQDTNPFAPPLVLYLLVHDPVSGVLVKLAGTVVPDPSTGQLTSTFANTPQLPFEELKLHFFDGARAATSTPPLCGSYATQASFAPWSGNTPSSASASFAIDSGPGGGACPSSPLPFSPGFEADSANPQAGAFTSFTLNVEHPDADQPLGKITMHLPDGVAAMLASVTPCREPQVASNQCGPDSLIGHSMAWSGLGSEPYALPGNVYLTGPYEGAPFGLSVVTPAVAGPFDLGDVTVRSKIEVDRSSAAVTITSDPFPTFVRGVPAQLKRIQVTVDRAGFEFNPTNCSPMSITGVLGGSQGASEPVSTPFQAQNCAALPFHPTLGAFTQGNASKADGASLTVNVTSQGLGVANIAKVALQLPKQLPSRLTTIQKACPAQIFESNPASFDEGSVIGAATIHTPVLMSPLTGPAYLVSHGGAAFPDVEFVLQGEGITLLLDGKTDIKGGITYSRFESAPDAPFTSFETVLPEGAHSALTSNVPASKRFSLCGQTLSMPTTITAQDGAVITQQTKIPVQGCAAVKAAKAKKLTLAQRLKQSLANCRRRYAHSKSRRISCERAEHARYTKLALAACRRADVHKKRKLASCEEVARRRFAWGGGPRSSR